jgi:hypothetical protein
MLSLQIVSDLHLEFYQDKQKFNFIKPEADILALLGDICCCVSESDFAILDRFLTEILPHFKIIIFVAGNHEYYSNKSNTTPIIENTISYTNNKIKDYCKKKSPKLIFLNNNTLRIKYKNKKYAIIGSTLWTFIPPAQRERIQKIMSDYRFIFTKASSGSTSSGSASSGKEIIRNINSADVSSYFLRNYTYIRNQIKKSISNDENIIILTHHCPILKENFNENTYDPAYMTDCSKLINKNVVLWAWGHTHIAHNKKINGTLYYSNPKGYPNQHTNFNPKCSVRV